jgi:hypothetical protein
VRSHIFSNNSLVGLELESRVTRSTAAGDPFCEWEHVLERTVRTEAFVAALSALRDV